MTAIHVLPKRFRDFLRHLGCNSAIIKMAREIDIKLRTTYDGKGGDAAEIDVALFPSRFGLHALFAVRNKSGKQVDEREDDNSDEQHDTKNAIELVFFGRDRLVRRVRRCLWQGQEELFHASIVAKDNEQDN